MSMDHPSGIPNTDFQSAVEKLISIGHSAAYLSCQIQEVTAILTGTAQGNPDPATVADDLGGDASKLDAADLMELINLENTRQALMRSWRYVEGRKAAIIEEGRARTDEQQAEQGGPVNA